MLNPSAVEYSADPLDMTVFQEFVEMIGEDDPDIIHEFIETFIDDASVYLHAMHQAMTKEDFHALRLASHTLKANSAQFGACGLSETCRQVELLSSRTVMNDMAKLIEEAHQEYQRVRERLLDVQMHYVSPPRR